MPRGGGGRGDKDNLDGEDERFARTKRIFLDMLCCLREFDGKSFNTASLNADRMNLYEIFIRMYIQETWVLVKRGIKSDYISNEDNLAVYKKSRCKTPSEQHLLYILKRSMDSRSTAIEIIVYRSFS